MGGTSGLAGAIVLSVLLFSIGASAMPVGDPAVDGRSGAKGSYAPRAFAQATPTPPATESPASPPAIDDGQRESIEADISTRSVAVTSSFTGTEIIVFGTVHNSQQQSRDAGLYDIVVVVEGTKAPIVARQKTNVGGIWINTESVKFEAMPSYYAIASTRPLAEVASLRTLAQLSIGFDHVLMRPRRASALLTVDELASYKAAVVRLKQEDKLYVREDYGVSFIGRGLFRTTIDLPANVPVGPLRARVYLFRGGLLLSQYSAQVRLEREGIERLLHTFATRYPTVYGLFTVMLAAGAGLLASAAFRRGR